MSTVLLDIHQALEPVVKDTLQRPPVEMAAQDIVFPSLRYKPVTGVPHARVDHLHAKSSPASAGVDSFTRRPGILQVSLYFPDGSGTGPALIAAQMLLDAFRRGSVFKCNTTDIVIQAASVGPFLKESEWLVVPVSIDWLVYSQD